jgi:hypothetical protein
VVLVSDDVTDEVQLPGAGAAHVKAAGQGRQRGQGCAAPGCKQPHKYTHPKLRAPYCSVACYKRLGKAT